ncbi:amino acid transporter [Paxillus ammoniavirescens]|nr:amino acid transporter [Paxillus ammoniavirescens]
MVSKLTMGTKGGPDTDLTAREGLHQLGYGQAMIRNRGLFHILFMTLVMMAVPFDLAAPIVISLECGGPVVMFWGWILVSVLTQALALSLAEICSKYPTSAGAYYWCFRLAPLRYKLLLSWINGWLVVVGNWTVTLSVTFGTAQMAVAGVGIYYPEWVAAPWQTYVIFLGVTAVACAFSLFFNKYLPTVDTLCVCWTALGILAILICVSVTAVAGRRPISFALGGFDASASGWTPIWSFFIGLLPVTYVYSTIGMTVSMAEEVHNPSETLPKAISWSVPIGTIWGIVLLLPVLFTLPDVATLLAVPSGQPIGLMFTLIMGSTAGGFTLWFIIFGTGMFSTISTSCAASRATWAFARDKAIPFHTHFAKINPTSDVPDNALLLSTAIQMLLGTIYLGSSTAFNAFVGVAVICLGTSNAMPVAVSLLNGRSDITDAPFRLGRLGWVVNMIAVLWITFSVVLFSMPAIIPTTQVTMNYASVVFVGFAVISAVWYLINGRFQYTGPPLPASKLVLTQPTLSC